MFDKYIRSGAFLICFLCNQPVFVCVCYLRTCLVYLFCLYGTQYQKHCQTNIEMVDWNFNQLFFRTATTIFLAIKSNYMENNALGHTVFAGLFWAECAVHWRKVLNWIPKYTVEIPFQLNKYIFHFDSKQISIGIGIKL